MSCSLDSLFTTTRSFYCDSGRAGRRHCGLALPICRNIWPLSLLFPYTDSYRQHCKSPIVFSRACQMHGRKQLSFCSEMCQFWCRLYQFSFLCQYRTVVPSTDVGCTSLAFCVSTGLWFQVQMSGVSVNLCVCQYRTVVPSTGVGYISLAYCNCVNSKLWFQVRVSSIPVSFTITVSIQDCGSKYGCRVYQCALLALQPNHKAEVNVAVKIMRSAISFPGVSVSPSHHPPP